MHPLVSRAKPCSSPPCTFGGFHESKVAFHGETVFSGERVETRLDGVLVMPVDVGATDHEVDGAAKGIGYQPSAGKRHVPLDAVSVSGTLVSSIGGCRDADVLCEILSGAEPCFAAHPLERSISACVGPMGEVVSRHTLGDRVIRHSYCFL